MQDRWSRHQQQGKFQMTTNPEPSESESAKDRFMKATALGVLLKLGVVLRLKALAQIRCKDCNAYNNGFVGASGFA
jgi:hypothetical protein